MQTNDNFGQGTQVTKDFNQISQISLGTQSYAAAASDDDSGGFFTVLTDIFKWLGNFYDKINDELFKYLGVATTSGCISSTTACFNDGYIIQGIKGQIAGFNRNLDNIFKSYFGIDHSSTNSVKAGVNDGIIAILLKSMIEILVTNFNTSFYVDLSQKSSDLCHKDGVFTCLFKAQIKLITDRLDFLAVHPTYTASSSCQHAGYFVDGPFTCLIKGQAKLIADSFNKSLDIFAVNPSYINSSSCQDFGTSGDGRLTCLIKAQVKLITASIDFTLKSFDIFAVNPLYINSSSCQDFGTRADGPFTCLIKGQVKLIITELKNITITGGAAPIDYQSKLDTISKKLDDLIKKVGDISLTKDGKTIWDFLTELVKSLAGTLDSILDFLDNIVDLIRDIIIPSDVSFISKEFDNINSKLSAKFSLVDTLSKTITTSFSVNESNLLAKDFTVNFASYGSITLLNVAYLNTVLPYAKRILSAVLYLLTAIYAYKKITNRMVE